MPKKYLNDTFTLAKTKDGLNQVELANGAVVVDSVDGISEQFGCRLQVDAYFSQWGLDLLIKHLESLKTKLTKE